MVLFFLFIYLNYPSCTVNQIQSNIIYLSQFNQSCRNLSKDKWYINREIACFQCMVALLTPITIKLLTYSNWFNENDNDKYIYQTTISKLLTERRFRPSQIYHFSEDDLL